MFYRLLKKEKQEYFNNVLLVKKCHGKLYTTETEHLHNSNNLSNRIQNTSQRIVFQIQYNCWRNDYNVIILSDIIIIDIIG